MIHPITSPTFTKWGSWWNIPVLWCKTEETAARFMFFTIVFSTSHLKLWNIWNWGEHKWIDFQQTSLYLLQRQEHFHSMSELLSAHSSQRFKKVFKDNPNSEQCLQVTEGNNKRTWTYKNGVKGKCFRTSNKSPLISRQQCLSTGYRLWIHNKPPSNTTYFVEGENGECKVLLKK